MKKRKLFIEAWPLIEKNVSGIGHTAYSMVHALSEIDKSHEIVLVVPRGTSPKLKRWNFRESVTFREIKIPRRVFNRLNRYGLLPPIDLFLGTGDYLFFNFNNWRLAFSNTFTYIHDISFIKYPEFVETRNQQMLEKYVPKWIQRSTKIITVSEYAKQEIADCYNVSPEKIEVIYNGVDGKEYSKKNTSEIAKLKKHLDIEGQYLLYFGNIEPRKNLIRLIQAYKKLPQNLRDTNSLLIMGGHGWNANEIIKAAQSAVKEGYKVILKQEYLEDKDLPTLYSGASALIHPAIYEGFGLSPLQAMACGTPVVVSNTSSLPEVVGAAGLYCDPFDENDIAEKIIEILNPSVQHRLSKNVKLQIDKFSWDKSAKKLLSLINSVGQESNSKS